MVVTHVKGPQTELDVYFLGAPQMQVFPLLNVCKPVCLIRFSMVRMGSCTGFRCSIGVTFVGVRAGFGCVQLTVCQ